MFGCSMGDDAVEHYMRGSKIYFHGCTRLRLPRRPAVEERGLSFMLLDPPSELPDEQLVLRALLLTAAYRLHCTLRLRPPFCEDGVLR